jgi:hypothetical protein
MSRIHIATRGIQSWKCRLASPNQFKRGYSAFETAVSWELSEKNPSGIPGPIEALILKANFQNPNLMIAVVEHKVDLPGGDAASQSDVWAIIGTSKGMISLTVEAKAKEPFGDEALDNWLVAGGSKKSIENRRLRWEFIRSHLPKSDSFGTVRYQLLHRCAAAIIEAKRFGFKHAACIVQSFESPEPSFREFAILCDAMKIPAERGNAATVPVNDISLTVGWADCPLATDSEANQAEAAEN